MKKILYISLVTVLSLNLFSNQGITIPLDNKFLSTENGGDNYAIDSYSDGIGIYTVGPEEEKFSAMNELVFSYGEEAKTNEVSLKDFVLDNGSDSEKELASLLGISSFVPSSVIGEICNDNNDLTTNDRYIDANGTCQGNSKPVISSVSGWDVLELGKTKSFSINAFDTDGETLSYTVYLINVSTDGAIISERNLGNNSNFNFDIVNPLFITGNQYKLRIKVSDGYNDTFLETNVIEPISLEKIVILSNGTVTCKNATPNTIEVKDGIEYYISPDDRTILANKMKGSNGLLDNGGDDFPAHRICTTHITNMGSLFSNGYSTTLSNIDQRFHNLNAWDTSNVIYMDFMFNGASSFNQPLNNWDVSKVMNMRYMFRNTPSFNQDITNWNVSNVYTWSYFRMGSLLITDYTPPKFR